MKYLRNALDLAVYALQQKVAAPARRWAWQRKSAPFAHRAEAGTFLLYPGEYIDSEIYIYGAFEHRVLRRLARRVGRLRTMLDIGANIGNHSIFLSGNFSSIHCFEPNPLISSRLKANIALSALANIAVHEVGLGHHDATLPYFHIGTGNMGGGSFVRADPRATVMQLPIVDGDAYIEKIGVEDVDFIKLDVEGFEPNVLAGLRRTIVKHQPTIVMEFDGLQPDRAERFTEISRLLPGYVFADAARGGGSGSLLGKALFTLQNGLEPPLVSMESVEERFYEAILAFPSREKLLAF